MHHKLIPVLVIVFVSMLSLSAQNAKIETLVNSVSQENILQHIDSLSYAGGNKSRISFTPGIYEAADYIARYMESLPGLSYVARDTFYMGRATAPYDTYPLINVVAQLDGTSDNPKTFIIGGHYDASGSRQSDYNFFWTIRQAQGADDNATGVASIMELARVLSDPAGNFKSEHNIRFVAFAGEEYHPVHPDYHHLGSLYDVQEIGKAGLNVNGVLVMDMIGYNPNIDYIEIISNTASTWLGDSVFVNAARYVPDLFTNSKPYPDVPYSDHQSYQESGYSAILLMENDAPWNSQPPWYTANPNYHTSSDITATLNMSQVVKVTKLGLATVAELNMDRTVSSVSATTFQDPVPGLTVYPNPFNSDTRILYTINKPGGVEIRIYDILGREIVDLYNGHQNSGQYTVYWNGLNAAGQPVVSGNYILSISMPGQHLVEKLMLIK